MVRLVEVRDSKESGMDLVRYANLWLCPARIGGGGVAGQGRVVFGIVRFGPKGRYGGRRVRCGMHVLGRAR